MTVGFVVILLILSGLLDLGRAYFVFVAVEDSVGEAALYLSINPGCRYASDGPECADPNNAEYRARYAVGNFLDWSQITLTLERPTVYGVGDPVAAQIQYSYRLIMPFIPQLAGFNPLTLTARATQIIISE
jgi:hypothetical protein